MKYLNCSENLANEFFKLFGENSEYFLKMLENISELGTDCISMEVVFKMDEFFLKNKTEILNYLENIEFDLTFDSSTISGLLKGEVNYLVVMAVIDQIAKDYARGEKWQHEKR